MKKLLFLLTLAILSLSAFCQVPFPDHLENRLASSRDIFQGLKTTFLSPKIDLVGRAVPGTEYLVYSNRNNQWVPDHLARRTLNSRNQIVAEYTFRYNNPLDTFSKSFHLYDSLGQRTRFLMYERRRSTRLELGYDVQYEYDSHGNLIKEFGSGLNQFYQFDTISHSTFENTYDSRGRLAVQHRNWLYVESSLNLNTPPDTVRRRRITVFKDSIFYQSPFSNLYGGVSSYQSFGSDLTLRPNYKSVYEYWDTIPPLSPKRWWQFAPRDSGWGLYFFETDERATNGRVRGTRLVYSNQSNVIPIGRTHVEYVYDDRLDDGSKTWNQLEYGYRSLLFEGLGYRKGLREIQLDLNTNQYKLHLIQDSVFFDTMGRLLIRATFQDVYSDDTTVTGPITKNLKYVFTDFLPTGLHPSTTPQTLAIAPGPSTNTALLVNLPAGQWQAILVSMQGRTTSLPSPDKTGVVKMPNLATGIYSLHLKDKTGRHLHGRFAWER